MVKRLLDMDNAKFGRLILGVIIVVEVIGYVVMISLNITVPPEYLDIVKLTVMALVGVVGAQTINGKIAHSK